MKVTEANRKEAAEYIMCANYGWMFGNFEIDMSDGDDLLRVMFGAALAEEAVNHAEADIR